MEGKSLTADVADVSVEELGEVSGADSFGTSGSASSLSTPLGTFGCAGTFGCGNAPGG